MSDSRVFEFTSGKLSFKSVEGTKGKEYFVKGYITSGDLDLVNDIVTKACMLSMKDQFDERTIKMDFEHEAYRGKSELESKLNKTRIPLGKAIERTMDEKGLLVKWKMNPTWKKFDEKGNVVMTFKDLWENVTKGFYDAFSIAYVVKKSRNKIVDGTKAQLLENVGLLNVALTGNPINPGASMTAVMAKSLAWLKDGEKTKSYPKDGAHAHTEENPIGEHNHPEIEKAISDIYNTIDRRMDYVHERIDDLKPATDEPGQMLKSDKKNLKGDIVADDTEKEEDGKEGAPDTTETKSQEPSPEMIQVKAALKEMSDVMTKDLKTVKDELKELKDKVEAQDKILSKAQTKALGAPAKTAEATAAPKVKSALGMIG